MMDITNMAVDIFSRSLIAVPPSLCYGNRYVNKTLPV